MRHVLERASLLASCSLVLVGCPPDKPPEPPPPPPPATEGEPCAVGEKVVRRCATGLACTAMAVTPIDPKERQVLSPEGGGCGGVGQIQCGEGLACLMNEDEALSADAMGICKTQSVCLPMEAEPAPEN